MNVHRRLTFKEKQNICSYLKTECQGEQEFLRKTM